MEAQELLRVIDGDERAWDEVVDRRGPRVVGGPRTGSPRRQPTTWCRRSGCASPNMPTGSANRNAWRRGWPRRRERGIAGDQGQQPPESAVDRRGLRRADDAIRGERVSDDATLAAVLRAFGQLSRRISSSCGCSARCLPSTTRPSPRCSADLSGASGRPGPGVWSASSGSFLLASTRKKDSRDPTDDELLELVGRALRTAEPVPDRVIAGRGRRGPGGPSTRSWPSWCSTRPSS